jgi:cytochrome c oxidase cbb3-type subunit 3
MSPLWSVFVIVVTVAMLGGCLWLLLANSRGVTGEVKDHVWDDDLREYNNPLPRWWFNLFILTLVFAAIYLALYPGLGNLGGRLGWTQARQLQTSLDTLTARHKAAFANLAGKDIPTLARDPAAHSLGRAIFLNNCAGCHGTDAQGAIGFPNLTDNDWLFGGDPESIVESITHGRQGQMPAFNGALSADALNSLLDFVPYWSDPSLSAEKRERGMKQFSITCAACHGSEGKGNTAIGAPNLTDDIWLFGGGREHVRETILFGRRAAMPAHEGILSPDEIRVVAAYVYGLSHNAAAAPAASPSP